MTVSFLSPTLAAALAHQHQLGQMRFGQVFLGFEMGALAKKEAVRGEARMAALWMGFEALQDPSLSSVFLGMPHPMLMTLVSRTFPDSISQQCLIHGDVQGRHLPMRQAFTRTSF